CAGLLDANRLVLLEALALDFHKFLALDYSLLARFHVLACLPFLHQVRISVLDRCTEFLDESHPGHAGAQGQAHSPQHQQQQRTAGKTEPLGEQAAHQFAEHAARRVRQSHLQRVQAQRLQCAAGSNEEQKTAASHCQRTAVHFRCVETAVTPDHCCEQEEYPPPRRQPEHKEQDVGNPRAGLAARVRDQGTGRKMRPSGIGLAVGEEDEYQVQGRADEKQPPRFPQQRGDFWRQRLARRLFSCGFGRRKCSQANYLFSFKELYLRVGCSTKPNLGAWTATSRGCYSLAFFALTPI